MPYDHIYTAVFNIVHILNTVICFGTVYIALQPREGIVVGVGRVRVSYRQKSNSEIYLRIYLSSADVTTSMCEFHCVWQQTGQVDLRKA